MNSRVPVLAAALLLPLALGGCLASAIKTVVTAPIKATGAVIDAATTNQDEADRNRGRAARKAEDRAEQRAERWAKQTEKDRRRAERQRRHGDESN